MDSKHYFYVLYCNDNSFYGGYTTDPKRRVKEHNSGSGAKYTRPASRRPVQMIHLEAFSTRPEATKAEYRFKKLARKQKERYLKTAQAACIIRVFEETDGKETAELLKRNFLEINSQDYSIEQMATLVDQYTPEKLIEQAKIGHTYTAEIGDTIVGTATICPYYGSTTESIILSFFILPEFQRKGIGHQLMKQLEEDPLYSQAERIEIPSSRSATSFYKRFGFVLKDATEPEDALGYVRLEKQL